MKKILLGIIGLLLMVSLGYCQDQLLQLTIKSDKQVYEVGEEIVFTLIWENLGNKGIQIHFREDSLLQGMLSFKDADGKELLKRGIMIEFAPGYKFTIPAGKTYTHELKGQIIREDLKEPYLLEDQQFLGNLILRFYGGTLSEIPILLGKPGKFYITSHYEMPADSYLVRTEPNTWAGTLISNTIAIDVIEKKLSK